MVHWVMTAKNKVIWWSAELHTPCVIRATRPLLLKFSCPKHVKIHDRLHKFLKQRRSSYYFLIKIYWFTNQVSYNTATVILNNKRNLNGFLAGLARWFQPRLIQQRLKIPPLKFLSAVTMMWFYVENIA